MLSACAASPAFAGPRPVSAAASSSDGDLVPQNAIDQNPSTRWSSRFNDSEWFQVDLGSVKDIVGVRLVWEAAFGQSYDISISQDGNRWQTVYRTESGDGLTDDIYFGRRSARWIRLTGRKRGTPWGYSLWEMSVKGLDEEIRMTASSADPSSPPENAVDADPTTQWSSGDTIEATLTMKMPGDDVIGAMGIDWGDDFSGWYRIRISRDGTAWTPVHEDRHGKGGVETISVNLVGARWIQIQCRFPNRQAGFSIREIHFDRWDDLARRSSLDRVRGLTGWVGGAWTTYVGRDGTFGPEPHPHQISFWVYDHKSKTLYTPSTRPTAWTLFDGRLPINVITWSFADIDVTTTVFTRASPDKNVWLNFARTSLHNRGDRARELSLYAVIRPNPIPRMKAGPGVKDVTYDGRTSVRINGTIGLVLPKPLDAPAPAGLDEVDLQKFDHTRILKAGPGISDNGGNASAAILYHAALDPGDTANYDFVVPSVGAPLPKADELDFETNFNRVRDFWSNLVPAMIDLPDSRYTDVFYSSIYYILIMMKGTELHPGPYGYNSFFLHDAVDMAVALDDVGLFSYAKSSFDHFDYHETDNYLDGLGATLFAFYEHYRLSRDGGFLDSIYPKMRQYCDLMKTLRSRESSAPDRPEHGLLPRSMSQDNFTMPSHLYYDDWYGVIGLKSTLDAANILKKSDDARWIGAEYDGLLKAITDSIRAVMKRDRISYIPALADEYPAEMKSTIDEKFRIFGATQMAWAQRPALDPGQSLDIPVPLDLLSQSYQYFWNNSGKFSGFDGGWYVEYEKFFWGYNVMLARPLSFVGMGDVALKNLDWSLRHQSCPGAWMEAMPTRENAQGLREIADGIVGDVPHGWVAGHYVELLRKMLLREESGALHILPNVPREWLAAGQVIDLRSIPTYFGPCSFRLESQSGQSVLTIDMPTPPASGFLLDLPPDTAISAVRINDEPLNRSFDRPLQLPPDAKTVTIEWMK